MTNEHRGALRDWLAFLRAESHVLREAPELVFQQAANQPQVTDPARRAATAGVSRPWLRLINKRRTRTPCLQVLTGHTGAVHTAGYSPDGLRIVSAGADHTARVWDAESGRELAVIEGFPGPVRLAGFLDPTRLIAATSERVRICDVRTGDELLAREAVTQVPLDPPGFSRAQPFALSPDRRLLATGLPEDPSTLVVVEVASGREVCRLAGHLKPIYAASFAPGGEQIGTGSADGTAKLWDLPGGRELITLVGHDGPVSACAYSPAGGLLATGSHDQTVKLWELATGVPLHTLSGHPTGIAILLWSPDGSRLLTGARPVVTPKGPMRRATVIVREEDSQLLLWDAAGKKLATLQHAGGVVWTAAFSPDGRRIASGAERDRLRVWDGRTGKELAEYPGHTGGVTHVEFAPDGRRIISASSDGTLRVWDPEAEGEGAAAVEECAFSPDGTRLVARRSSGLALCDGLSGAELRVIRTPSWTFTPDGKHLLTERLDRVTLATGEDAEPIRLRDEQGRDSGRIRKIASSGTHALTTSGEIRIWNLETGRLVEIAKEKDGCEAEFSADGSRVLLVDSASDVERSVTTFDTATGARLFRSRTVTTPRRVSPDGLRMYDHDALTGARLADATGVVEYSPDGERLLCHEGRLLIRDAGTGERLATLEGAGGARAGFSPDGRYVAALGYHALEAARDKARVGRGRQLQVWEAGTGRLVCSYALLAEFKRFAWSPDGTRLAVGTDPAGLLLLALENFPPGPLPVTCWVAPRDRRHGFQCPLCGRWSAADAAELGAERQCPGCDRALRLNPFVRLGDWEARSPA